MYVRSVFGGEHIVLMPSNPGLEEGKPPWRILSELLSLLPSRDVDLVMGPSIGEDAAILRLGDGFLVVHADPITTATSMIGWLAVHVSANDIAVRGVRPRWFVPVVMMPSGIDTDTMRKIFSDMGEALRTIGGTVIGGHTEISPELSRPIIAMTAIGYTRSRVIMTRDAQPGDKILVIGHIGGEGAAVIASDFGKLLLSRGIDKRIINEARKYIKKISVVEKALKIKDYVNAMHDPTEGGVLQALREIALASGNDIIVDRNSFQVDDIVKIISEALGLDPLKLLSSGTLIATVPRKNLDKVMEILDEMGEKFSVVGDVVPGNGRLILRDHRRETVISEDIIDEIYKVWKNNLF